MTRQQAIPYISFCLDDALSVRKIEDMPKNARLIGWQCGFEPLFVAVWSYLDVELSPLEATEIATDYLREIEWFGENERPQDYIL